MAHNLKTKQFNFIINPIEFHDDDHNVFQEQNILLIKKKKFF